MPRTIGARLLLASIASLVISLTVLAVAAPIAARQHETDTIGARLAGEAPVLAEFAREPLVRGDAAALDMLAKRIGSSSQTRIAIVARDGTVLGESDGDPRTMDDHAGRPEVAAALTGAQGRAIRASTTLGRELLYVAVPVRSGGTIVGVARAALAVAFLLDRAITRPLVELTRRAAGDLSGDASPFKVHGPEEVERLGSALETMAKAGQAARVAVEAERDRLATLISELSDAVLIVGADDRVQLANPAAETMLGKHPLAGRKLVDIVRDHEVFDAVSRARAGGGEITAASDGAGRGSTFTFTLPLGAPATAQRGARPRRPWRRRGR